MTDQLDVAGAPYPGAPATYVEASVAGVALRPMRWGLPDIAIALLLALIVPIVVIAPAIAMGAPTNGAFVLLAGATTPWVGFLLWPWLTTRMQGNGARIDLGLAFRPVDALWGLAGGVVCLVLGTGVASLVERFHGPFDSAAGAAVTNADVPRWVVLAFALCALVGAPLAEELCFRGLAFAAIAKSCARRGVAGAVPWATVLSALLFSLTHLEPVRIPILLTIGLVLSWLRARTGRIGASVVAHALNNLVGILGLLLAS